MFGKKKNKKYDYREKLDRIERSIWELENKQIVDLDKLKAVVAKQADYKQKGKSAADRNMQRHWASLYLNCEKEKEQIAASINQISKEIVTAARMAQLVDTQALTIELEKTESLTLAEINEMSDSIAKSRTKREAEQSLKDEAIDRALRVTDRDTDSDVDRVLGLWEEEKSAEDELRLTEQPVAAPVTAPEVEADSVLDAWEAEETDAPDKDKISE